MSQLKENQLKKIDSIYGSLDNFRDILYDMTDRIFQWSKKNNQNLFLFYGSLLGFTRENRIIGWDNDVDTGIIDTEFDRSTIQDLENFGFEPVIEIPRYHRHDNTFCTEIYSIYNKDRKSKFEFIDINPLKDKNEENVFYRWWYKDIILPKKYFEKFQEKRWNDKCTVIVPRYQAELLSLCYGKLWYKPKAGRQKMLIKKEYEQLIYNRLKELKIKTYPKEIKKFFKF